ASGVRRAPGPRRFPMTVRSWFGKLLGRKAGPLSTPQPAPRRARLAVEALEDRLAPAVSLSISSPLPLPEGDSGSSNLVFVVTRSGDLSPSVQVNYATQDGSGPNGAKAGSDYEARSGTLTLAANQTTATIAVPVLGNTRLQADRSFTVVLSSPQPVS